MRRPAHQGDEGRPATRGQAFWQAPATFVLIAINVAVFLAEIAGGAGGLTSEIPVSGIVNDFGLRGISVAEGEWYRLLTSGFLHAGLLHIGFNMFAALLPRQAARAGDRDAALLSPSTSPRCFAGSFGALLLTNQLELTVGASGAIFGIFGATFVIARGRGSQPVAARARLPAPLQPRASPSASADISVGGHLGGLAGGLLCALLISPASGACSVATASPSSWSGWPWSPSSRCSARSRSPSRAASGR